MALHQSIHNVKFNLGVFTYEYDLFLHVRAIYITCSILGEVGVAHHGELFASMRVVQCNNQRVIVVYRLAQLIGRDKVHVEAQRPKRNRLFKPCIESELCRKV